MRKNMNRRDLLKSAIALPLLGFVPKAEASLNLKFEISKEDALKSWILQKCEELKIHPTDWQLAQLIRMFGEESFIKIETKVNQTTEYLDRGGYGKSYLLAIYYVLLADSPILIEDRKTKIIVTSSTLVQCKTVLKYIVSILGQAKKPYNTTWLTHEHSVEYRNTKIYGEPIGYKKQIIGDIILIDDYRMIPNIDGLYYKYKAIACG